MDSASDRIKLKREKGGWKHNSIILANINILNFEKLFFGIIIFVL